MASKSFSKDNEIDLKYLIESKFEAVYKQFDSNEKYYNQRFENLADQTHIALVSADKATKKAEDATEKRFESVNEFRATLTDQARSFLTKAEFDAKWEAIKADKADRTALWFSLFGVVMSITSLILRLLAG